MTKDKERSSAINILSAAIERIIMDAAAVFPMNDPYLIIRWTERLKVFVIEAVKRQTMSGEPKYKDLSIEEKAEVIFQRAHEETKEIFKKRDRKSTADSFLTLETEGPPPLPPPEESDEQPAPPETSDSHSEEQ